MYFRYILLIIFAFRFLYWVLPSNVSKKKVTFQLKMKDYILYFAWLLIGLQLLGIVEILHYDSNIFIEVIGFVVGLSGVITSVASKYYLGKSWTHAGETQIVTDHKLITSGIYSYIRHPIYIGVTMCFVGAELLIGSYLVMPFAIAFAILSYVQAKQEEKLLISNFGEEYAQYMKVTKMFVPFVY